MTYNLAGEVGDCSQQSNTVGTLQLLTLLFALNSQFQAWTHANLL